MPDSGNACLNCGQPAGPRFCGYCGQSLHDRRSPLAGLVRELVEESLAVDSRTIRTFRALPRPGLLTRLYLEGKRVAFLTPLRVYLTTSVILFSSLLALEAPDARQINLSIAGESVTGPRDPARPSITIMDPSDATQRWMISYFADKFAELRRRPPQELVTRLFAELRRTLPGALIVFLPVLAFALKLLYVRQRVLYVDHLVFGAHFQSALFVALAVAWGVVRLAGLSLLLSLVAYLLVFLFMLTIFLSRSLRRVYAQGWTMTIAKTIVLFLAYLALLNPVIGLAVFLVLWRL